MDGTVWNRSVDDKNHEAIISIIGVEALVSFYG
jgi:hypothetical protein